MRTSIFTRSLAEKTKADLKDVKPSRFVVGGGGRNWLGLSILFH